MPPESLTGV